MLGEFSESGRVYGKAYRLAHKTTTVWVSLGSPNQNIYRNTAE